MKRIEIPVLVKWDREFGKWANQNPLLFTLVILLTSTVDDFNMKHVESPEEYHCQGELSLFLGGGITNCGDWQADLVNTLKCSNLTLLNPRRNARFEKGNSNALKEQITWEHKHMRLANAITFWFPIESVASMTIFELGAWLPRTKKLFIGFNPTFRRKESFTIQTHLERPEEKIYDSLNEMAKDILEWEQIQQSPLNRY